MAVEMSREIIDIMNNPESLKILATVNEQNVPHAVVKQTIRIAENSEIEYLELLESSTTYKNFVHSLWFHHPVAITVKGPGNTSFQIQGQPKKVIISGPVFEQNYVAIRQKLGDVDLAAVCIIEPISVADQTFAVRFADQEKSRPFFKHLDRLAKPV
jgi:hypothetical protein